MGVLKTLLSRRLDLQDGFDLILWHLIALHGAANLFFFRRVDDQHALSHAVLAGFDQQR